MVTAVENFLMLVKAPICLWLFMSGHLCCFLSSYTAELWVIACVGRSWQRLEIDAGLVGRAKLADEDE